MVELNRAALRRSAERMLAASLAFWAFFQFTKWDAISAVNPFAEDPVDAIGSFAIQIAALASLLSLARALSWQPAAADARWKAQRILRGEILALASIAITLAADALKELQHPSWPASIWGKALVVGLWVIGAFALWAGAGLARCYPQAMRLPSPALPPGETGQLADALWDLWAMALAIPRWLGRWLPWLERLTSRMDGLAHKISALDLPPWHWFSAREHPWRFGLLVALGAGAGLSLAHGISEGFPADWKLAVFVSLLFLGVESAAAMVGYWLLGGYLGLRPGIRASHSTLQCTRRSEGTERREGEVQVGRPS